MKIHPFRLNSFLASSLAALSLLGLLVLSQLTGCSHGPKQKTDKEMEDEAAKEWRPLAQELKKLLTEKKKGRGPLDKNLLGFYAVRGFRPTWFRSSRDNLDGKALALLKELERAGEHGLRPFNYNYDGIFNQWELIEEYRRLASTNAALAESVLPLMAKLELLLSTSFLKYAQELSQGKASPEAEEDPPPPETPGAPPTRPAPPVRPIFKKVFKGKAILSRLDKETPKKILDELVPPHPGYLRLKEALHTYALLEKGDTLPALGAGKLPLKKGMKDPRVPLLWRKLLYQGEVSSEKRPRSNHSKVFDLPLEHALKSFQARHGIPATGKLDERSRLALNVPIRQRMRQLELNMERWRWPPPSFGDKYILVNIADYHLSVVEEKDYVLNMKVIVGKRYRKTPIFSSKLTSLTINPTWTVPKTILLEDMIPKMRKDPAFLEKMNIKAYHRSHGKYKEVDADEVPWDDFTAENYNYEYLLRQAKGSKNPLGSIIFHIPNRFQIYLHDTPGHHSFSQDDRGLSSGCIRLERPQDLALYLLKQDPTWNKERLKEQIKKGDTLFVKLPHSVPVYLLYWTAWVNTNGVVHFRDDIYERDYNLARQFYHEGRAENKEIPSHAQGPAH